MHPLRFAAFSALVPFVSTLVAAELPPVVPAVKSWKSDAGDRRLPAGARFLVKTDDTALARIAANLTSDAKPDSPQAVSTASPSGATDVPVRLVLAPAAAPLPGGPQAYRVTIAAAGVTIAGNTPDAVVCGTRVLLQVAKLSPAGLPLGTVDDSPDYARRMLMLDVGRKAFPIPVLKDYIRLLAWYRMNELHLHLSDEAFGGGYAGFRIESKKFPGLASKDLAYTQDEIRELQTFAHGYGVTLTPEIDMPGHARCFTNFRPDLMLKGYPNYVDVTNPKTAEFLKQLLDEMVPLFDAPDFHIGTDEYRVGNRPDLHEAFRQFINTMNAHVRSLGKNTRIWSGFEHMKGTTQIDPSVTIDMWETDDARSQIARGHSVINSNHGRTYIVPGAGYYGINPGAIYANWEPWMVSNQKDRNPGKTEPKLLGGKLHVWNDQGPTGYTHTEIAREAMRGLPAFAEKLWGVKGSPDFNKFTARTTAVGLAPGVTVLDRVESPKSGVVLDQPGEVTLADANASVDLPLAKSARANLENPWTLTMRVMPTGEAAGRGVILGSELSEICSAFTKEETVTTDFADGTKRKTKVKFSGLGVVRAAGYYKSPDDPSKTYLSNDLSRTFKTPLEKGRWSTVTLVATDGKCVAYIDGKKVGESGGRQLCPLRTLGSKTGESFVGKIAGLRVLDRALSPEEVAAQAK